MAHHWKQAFVYSGLSVEFFLKHFFNPKETSTNPFLFLLWFQFLLYSYYDVSGICEVYMSIRFPGAAQCVLVLMMMMMMMMMMNLAFHSA